MKKNIKVTVRDNEFLYGKLKDALTDGHPAKAEVYKNEELLGTVGALIEQGLAGDVTLNRSKRKM